LALFTRLHRDARSTKRKNYANSGKAMFFMVVQVVTEAVLDTLRNLNKITFIII